MFTIYAITNVINGKNYIGQTSVALGKRFYRHIYSAKYGIETRFYNSIRKYGPEAFVICQLRSCLSKAEVNIFERFYILLFSSNMPEFGYNSTFGGDGGQRPTRETLEKMSKIHAGRVTDSQRIRMSLLGKSSKGIPRSAAVRRKISDSKRLNPRFVGVDERGATAERNRKRKGICTPAMWAHIRTKPALKEQNERRSNG